MLRIHRTLMNLPESQRLHGLTPATHTPFHSDGTLHLEAVEAIVSHLLKWNISSVFIGGSTGESHSLTLKERLALTERWIAVARGTPLRVVVHVGSNCLDDAATLASHAQQHGAAAISALSPSYFKPRNLDALIAGAVKIAAAAPETPFYHYDIPSMTGVSFSMPEFLAKAAERIPTLAGLKFTTPDLMAYLQCLRMNPGRWDIPWGMDEWMLGALATGARGAVGSSFNFAAPVYQRLMAAFARNDLEAARTEQLHSTQVISILARHGYMGAAKATMEMLGVPVGPPRLPNNVLEKSQKELLRSELESLGFFDWVNSN